MNDHKIISLGGSRSLQSQPVVAAVVAAALAAGFSVQTGCAAGADALVIRSVLAAGAAGRLVVFSAFFPGGAPALVSEAFAAGARVFFSSFSGPLAARLAARSRSAVVSASVCAWFLSPSGQAAGSGSLKAAAFAAKSGKPVFVFQCGVPYAPASIGAGCWLPSKLWGFPCWRWLPLLALGINSKSK